MTRSGQLYEGQIRLNTNELVVVSAGREEAAVHVHLTNLMELSFEKSQGIADEPTGRRETWETVDIGHPKVPGRSRVVGGFYELTASPRTVPEAKHFFCRKVQGDAEIAARVIGISPAGAPAAGGLMITDSLAADAAFVAATVTSDRRLTMSRRAEAQGVIDVRSDRLPAQWLKLKREGTNVTAYRSSDGRRWNVFHSIPSALGTNIYIGLLLSAEYQREPMVEEIKCGFDHVREAPFLVPDWFVPRVELESGSIVLGRIGSADSREIRFHSVFAPAPLSTRAVSRIMFDWLPPQARVPEGQSGVLLSSGEFVEGVFESITGNKLAVNSVLFGRRVLDINGEVVAVLLRPAQSQDPVWELTTRDRSRWIGASIEISGGELAVWDASLGRRAFAAYDLDLVRFVRPSSR